MSIVDTVQSLFSERLARRREVRKQLAALELDKRACDEIRASLAKLDQVKERAAKIHADTTSPAQVELKEISDKMADAIADRLPIPPVLETRRRELLQAVHSANETLEREIAAQDRLAVPLKQDLFTRTMRLTETQVLENRLGREPLANPQWIMEHSSLAQAVRFARARLDSAREGLEKYEDAISPRERVHFTDEANRAHESRRDFWQFELAAAQRALDAAKAESDALYRKILDE